MRQQLSNKICPIIILIVVFITAISFSILSVHAEGSFADSSEAWSGIQNSLAASPNNTYPYNAESGVTVKSVSLDILYGTSKGWGLAQYHGEVPYKQAYDDNDNAADGFGKKYARPGTTIDESGTNPDGSSAKDYWGFDSSTDITINGESKQLPAGAGEAKLSDYEKINDEKVISLRLYALSHVSNWFEQFLGNILYSLSVGLASLATMVLQLIVDAKNIDMEAIMDMLNLKELIEIVTKSFIYDSDSFSLSPFALFAIIMFIFALVACGVRYAKGSDRKTGLKDIIITALAGVLVIGMCLSGNIVSLGSAASDLANKFITTAAAVMSSGSAGNAFVNDINDTEHSNKVTQISEMTLINKAFIDMQICAQFGVYSIDDLNIANLGDSSGSNTDVLMQYSDGAVTMASDFDNNLGYYYWFANSSAAEKTSLNATFPETNASATENKLNAIITYLQKNYNGTSDQTIQNNIRKIILSLSSPNGASGALSLLLLTAILIALAFCLFKYCLSVMIGKLELFISIIGLAAAGPLMLTTNKKLVNTGKAIVGMIPVAFIEITVYSIFFDLIIYLIASLIDNNIIKLIVVLFLVILLLKLNPVIQEKVKQLLNNATRAISPALSDTKRAIKTYTRQKANNLINSYDKSKKVVGYDKDGKEILQERGGNALSKLLHQGYNSVYNEGMQRESIKKIGRKENEVRAANKSKSAAEIRRDAEASIGQVMGMIDSAAAVHENSVIAAEKDFQSDCYYKSGDEIVYNKDNLTDDEKAKLTEISNMRAEMNAIVNSSDYKSLMNTKLIYEAENNKHRNDANYKPMQLDADDQNELSKLIEQANEKSRAIEKLDATLKQSIDSRARDFAFSKVGLDKNVAGKTDEEKLKNAAKLKAQNDKSKDLDKALQNGINAVKNEVNTKKSSKIGSSTETVNKAAMTSSAAMMYQRKQLQEGKIVSSTAEAKNKVEDVVNTVSHKNDSHYQSNEVERAKDEKKKADGLFQYGTKEDKLKRQAKAAENLETAKQNDKDDKKAGKQNYKDAKHEYGRPPAIVPIGSKAKIDEQLQTMINKHDLNESNNDKDLTKAAMNKASEENDDTRPVTPLGGTKPIGGESNKISKPSDSLNDTKSSNSLNDRAAEAEARDKEEAEAKANRKFEQPAQPKINNSQPKNDNVDDVKPKAQSSNQSSTSPTKPTETPTKPEKAPVNYMNELVNNKAKEEASTQKPQPVNTSTKQDVKVDVKPNSEPETIKEDIKQPVKQTVKLDAPVKPDTQSNNKSDTKQANSRSNTEQAHQVNQNIADRAQFNNQRNTSNNTNSSTNNTNSSANIDSGSSNRNPVKVQFNQSNIRPTTETNSTKSSNDVKHAQSVTQSKSEPTKINIETVKPVADRTKDDYLKDEARMYSANDPMNTNKHDKMGFNIKKK